jgi:methanophenazine hydrogenase, cytochrome b subunit
MDKMVVTRHTTLERLGHYINIVSLALLFISGFDMYWSLPYLAYGDAHAIHILAAAVFLSVNWIMIPYNAFVNMSLRSYMFWGADFKRLWGVIKNFFGNSEYPPYTVYDTGKKRFVNRMHPASKILLYVYYIALFVATITGILMYSGSLTVLGFNISLLILRIMNAIAPSFNLSGLALAIVLHVAMAYLILAEVIIHIGIQLDPRKFPHMKSMFIDGKEDVLADTTADIVDTSERNEEFEENTVIKIK